MSTSQFLDNQRRVLKLAYEHAGYDVESYTSETDYLRKRVISKNGPFIVPMPGANEESPQTESKNPEKPEGTECWLPYLPTCGINKMSYGQLSLYWNLVMRAVLPERKRYLGFESSK